MAVTIHELLEWLGSPTMKIADEVGIDDGGLTLRCVRDPEIYLEVGGMPEDRECLTCGLNGDDESPDCPDHKPREEGSISPLPDPPARARATITRSELAAQNGQPDNTPHAFHDYMLITQADGAVLGCWRTNDDDDDGIPDGKITTFSRTFQGMDEALRWAGRDRVGISGVIVRVFSDGKEVK